LPDAGFPPPPPLPATTVWKPCGRLGAGWPQDIAHAPDGKRILVGYGDGSVSLFAAGGGKPIFSDLHGSTTAKVAFSRDGVLFASLDYDALNVWRADGSDVYQQASLGFRHPHVLRFTPTHATGAPYLLLVATDPQYASTNIQIWQVTVTLTSIDLIRVGGLSGSADVALGRDSASVLRLDGGSQLTTLDFQGRQMGAVDLHAVINAPVFSPDGLWLAGTDAADGQLVLYGQSDGGRRWKVRPATAAPRRLLFPGSGPRLFELGPDRLVVHGLADGSVQGSAPVSGASLVQAEIAPDGGTVAGIDDQGALVRLATGDGSAQPAPVAESQDTDDFLTVSFSRNGRYLAASAHDGVIWDLHSRSLLATMSMRQLEFAPRSDRVAISNVGCALFSVQDDTNINLPLGSCTAGLVFSPDGSRLAGVSDQGISVFDADGKLQMQLASAVHYPGLAFSSDGAWLVSSAHQLWSTRDWTERWHQPLGNSAQADSFEVDDTAVLSPDETQVLRSTSRRDPIALSWTTFTQLHAMPGGGMLRDFGTDLARRPSFSPDGAWIAAGPKVWHLASPTVRDLDAAVQVSRFLPDGRIVAGQRGSVVTFYCPVQP
jgi:WD40 repeat protein